VNVAALYVDPRGPYPKLLGPEMCWDEKRDARTYAGPWPVVAHPPCARWCRLARFVQARHPQLVVGDDKGTFASALKAVRTWGGVLEHPAWSMAWGANNLSAPPAFGWHLDIDGGWCCEVSQAAYGHRARKLTWLYYVGDVLPPALDWSRPDPTAVVGHCYRRGDGTYWRGSKIGPRISKGQTSLTPPAFAQLLISIAQNARKDGAA
jgi:hypothetical protein